MRVLSLFDGISCGMVALERAGIEVERYDAFEIDKYAIQVSEKNYPQIVHHGDVFEGDFRQFKGYDLLLGGSPCTFWSIARNGRETTPDGMGGKLFMEYVRALRESGCKYFLYENNFSIHQNIKDFITEQLGVEPIMINSALVSAQHRKRMYWTNIPNVSQPEDKGILLQDILEEGIVWQDKSYCFTSSYHPTFYDCMDKHRNTLVAEPCKSVPFNTVKGKSHTITATYYKIGESPFSTYGCEKAKQRVAVPIPINTCQNDEENDTQHSQRSKIAEPVGIAQRGRYVDTGNRHAKGSGSTKQFLEARTDRKSNCLTTVQKDSMVAVPINACQNGEKARTVMAGYYKYGEATLITNKGFKGGATAIAHPVRIGEYGKGGQGQRIYSVRGKSVTISANGGGQGAKTGLYRIDLPDGDYIVRKLTPVEAERLQTLPDNYTEGISNTQRYRCIGNGWTVSVISHLLGGLK